MNIFRLIGDLSHLLAIIILLQKIWYTRSCAGISGKSQILFALVYTARYLDLMNSFVSLYNTLMKVIFLATSYATIYLIYMKFRATYDRNHDTFRIEFLVIPAAIVALLINHHFSLLEILWTFSIYLEAVAILPQLFMVSKTGEAESITSHYLFALGSYRGLYILNWIYRYATEGTCDWIAVVAGVVQTVLYCDFFYLYVTKDTWPNDPFCYPHHHQPAATTPPPIFSDDTPLSEDVVFSISTLTVRLEQELRAAKRSHLSCGEVLLPCGLLLKVARDIASMAESEPCGLRGCHLYVLFEPQGPLPSTRIAKIECDPGTACTFELYLTFKQSSNGWNFLPQFLRNLTRGGTVVLSPAYTLSKKKLYRSHVDQIQPDK